MNKSHVAALIRGLLINLTKKPHVVVWESPTKNISEKAMNIKISSPENAENDVRKAYGEWKEKQAADKSATEVLLPSCVYVTGAVEALFWTGNDLDSARKHLAEKDATPVWEKIASINKAALDPDERALVLKNKLALVTGGAQGIGEEIVINLAASGALVFIADINLEGARELAKKINAGRTSAIALEVDVSNEASVEALFNTIAELAGGLDLCVSNAGVLKAGSVLEQDLADFKFVTDVNYSGFFTVTKYAGRLLRVQHLTAPDWKTDIIQINSKSGLEGSNKNAAYSGGKFGGLGLVSSFAKELIEYNIKVNAICPGNFLDGPLWSDPDTGLFVQYLKAGKVPGAKNLADVRAFYEAKVPMKRGCTGKDVMRALRYIVEQEYETGQAVPVTGGQVMLH